MKYRDRLALTNQARDCGAPRGTTIGWDWGVPSLVLELGLERRVFLLHRARGSFSL